MQIGAFLKNRIVRVRAAFLRFLARRDPAEYFIALMIVGVTVFGVRCLIFGSETFTEIFHIGTRDLFMDFFNSVRDAAQGAASYTERGVIYPPLANLLFLLLSRLIPTAYLSTPTGEMAHTWRFYNGALLALVLFSAISLVLFALALGREGYSSRKGTALTFLMLVSFPVIFMVERGNIVVLALAALVIFAQNYQSECPARREVALLALAVAAALKLYPALFGLIMLADKRYRDALRAALYTVILLVVPSFFFGGPVSLWYVLKNTLCFSSTGENATSFMSQFNLSPGAGTAILCVLYLIALTVLLLSSLLQKTAFKTWMFAGAIMLTFSSIFSAYNWLLLLPALLTFMRTERLRGINWLYFFAMSLPFYIYIPKPLQDDGLIVLIALMITLSVIETVRLLAAVIKKKRTDAI